MPKISEFGVKEIAFEKFTDRDLLFVGEDDVRHHFGLIISLKENTKRTLVIEILYQIYKKAVSEKMTSRCITEFVLTEDEIQHVSHRNRRSINILGELSLISYSHARVFIVDRFQDQNNFSTETLQYQSLADLKRTVEAVYPF